MTRGLLVLLLFLSNASCGENVPPTVREVRVSNPLVQRGQPFYLTLIDVEDPDGNVYGGKVRVKATPTEGGVELEESLYPYEPDRDQTKGDIIFGVNINGDVPLGRWNVDSIYEDAVGEAARPAHAEVTLTQ